MIRIFLIAVTYLGSAYLGQVVFRETPFANWICGVVAGMTIVGIALVDYNGRTEP